MVPTNAMKASAPLTALSLCIACPVVANFQEDIQWGVESVTGYRSGYVYRGFELSESTMDFQVEAEIALNNHVFLSLGSWFATESGEGDYDESGVLAHLRWEQNDQLTLGIRATYRNFNHSSSPLSVIFKDGVDLGSFATWEFNDDLNATAGAYYDFGAEAWYGNAETQWSKALSSKTFISLNTGMSYVDNYYGRNGMNDAYGRLSLTHHLSDTVSLTPFIGGSLLLDGEDSGDDQAFAGMWFEVRF